MQTKIVFIIGTESSQNLRLFLCVCCTLAVVEAALCPQCLMFGSDEDHTPRPASTLTILVTGTKPEPSCAGTWIEPVDDGPLRREGSGRRSMHTVCLQYAAEAQRGLGS